MTAAKVLDVIGRLPHCAGQAADAVSAHTQVRMEDAPKLLKILKSERPDMWRRLPRHTWPTSWSHIEDLWFLSKGICTVTHLLASCGKDNLKKFHWDQDGKHTELGMLLCASTARSCQSVYVDDRKMAGRNPHLNTMWKI